MQPLLPRTSRSFPIGDAAECLTCQKVHFWILFLILIFNKCIALLIILMLIVFTMHVREMTLEQGDLIEDASKVAEHIFLFAVVRTAEMMEISDFNGEDVGSRRAVCGKYSQIVAGFMQAIAVVYESEETKESLERIERSVGDLQR